MSNKHQIYTAESVDEPSVKRLAELLALKLAPGDVVTLNGTLGAGKTTFARAIIRALADDPGYEVPSPTYAIAQDYPDARLPVAHFDWYRLSDPAELDEIGFPWSSATSHDDASLGLALVEWSERAPDALPDCYLSITLTEPENLADRRTLEVSIVTRDGVAIPSETRARLRRFAELTAFAEAFAASAGKAPPRISHLNGDASTRSYARLTWEDGDTALMMDSPAMPDGPALAGGKAYSRVAHLAETITPFLAVTEALSKAGLTVPTIRHADSVRGFAIIDDLGDDVFDQIAGDNTDLRTHRSEVAIDALIHLREKGPAPETIATQDMNVPLDHRLHEFDAEAVHAELDLLLQWAMPPQTGDSPAPHLTASFHEAWANVLEATSCACDGWVLRDYHSPNLIWCAKRTGINRVGIIDYQDAMRGPWAYDVVSLIQDARVDMAPELQTHLLERYCNAAKERFPGFEADAFRADYAVFGAQRATKVIGIFHRLATRDGKPRYLAHLPRVRAYLADNLAHPLLAPVKDWAQAHAPELLAPDRTA